MKVSVVIACHNEERTLAETLAGVAAQEWDEPWEVLFADNGSTDGSRAIFLAMAAGRPDWRVIDAGARRGKSYAMNLAMAAARAPAVLFCDADDVPAPGWLAAMGRALARHPFVACRAEFDRLNAGWVRDYRRYGANETGLGRINFPPFAVYGSGNTLGMTRAIVAAVGPFAEDLEALEDKDFCIRAALAGFELVFVPEAVMHVRFRDSLPALARQNYTYSKGGVGLGKRYAAHRPRGWTRRRLRRHLRTWAGLVPEYLAVRFGEGRDDPLAQAAFRWKLARAAGTIAGMLRYRSLPP
jgi:glycosyltransferase involved in cell wall biosynthesis